MSVKLHLHPRHNVVEKAREGLDAYISGVVEAWKMTPTEIVGLLLHKAADYQLYALRQERHPCCSGPADVVCACKDTAPTHARCLVCYVVNRLADMKAGLNGLPVCPECVGTCHICGSAKCDGCAP